MIREGKQYAVVIFKDGKFAPCTGCPFHSPGDGRIVHANCTAEAEGLRGCVDIANERKLSNKFSLTFREIKS